MHSSPLCDCRRRCGYQQALSRGSPHRRSIRRRHDQMMCRHPPSPVFEQWPRQKSLPVSPCGRSGAAFFSSSCRRLSVKRQPPRSRIDWADASVQTSSTRPKARRHSSCWSTTGIPSHRGTPSDSYSERSSRRGSPPTRTAVSSR